VASLRNELIRLMIKEGKIIGRINDKAHRPSEIDFKEAFR